MLDALDSIFGFMGFLIVAAIGAVSIGIVYSQFGVDSWIKRWKGTEKDRSLLDPTVHDALDAKNDLARGQRVVDRADWKDATSGGENGGDGDGGGD